AIRFRHATGNEVIHKNAKIGLATLRIPALFALRPACGIQTREQALRSGLFIAGSSVDLPRKEQVLNRAGLKGGMQSARGKILVLNRIAGAHNDCVLQATHGTKHRELNTKRQAGRHTVWVYLSAAPPFWFQEYLVAALVGETMNLVFDGRTIPRPYPFDGSRVAIHRRTIQT